MNSSSIIGQKLGNKYEIVELIGKGGMATVYKGYQAEIDRYVAIKVLPPHPGQDAEFVKRFQLEARTIARLQHPHILPVYDYGAQGDILYLAVAYIEGGSLATRIAGGRMPLQMVNKYLNEISSALDYAHRQGIVHRDIKPDNILIGREGYALLADFGIAKLLGGDTKLTATGGLVGTPAYMAPEQAVGGVVGPAADIYALGVVTFEMVTGKLPYNADTPMQIVMKHVTDPVPRLGDVITNVPPALDIVMARVLSKEPSERYMTATAFADDFKRATQGEEIQPPTVNLGGTVALSGGPNAQPTVPQASGQTTAVSPTTNRLVILGGMVIIALLVVAVVALLIFVNNQGNKNTPGILNGSPQPTTDLTRVASAATAAAVPTFGKATFSTAISVGDTLNVRAEGLPLNDAGKNYVVWLANSKNDSDTPLKAGTLTIDGLGNGVLSYTDPDGTMLPGTYNTVLITSQGADTDTPEGDVVFHASYPVEFMGALQEILGSAEDGIDGASLTESAISEAKVGDQHANLAASSTNMGGLLTHTEHTMNIYQGTEVDYNGNGRGENPSSSKLGVVHFLGRIIEELDQGLDAPDTTLNLQNEAELIRVCAENTRSYIDQVMAIDQQVLTVDSVEAAADDEKQVTSLTDAILNGRDANNNGQVEPFEGECGLTQIETFGVLSAVLDIVAGPPS